MAKKYEIITELYRKTVSDLADPVRWQGFLRTACHNFRLSFEDQVLLYAQRPDATAVLPIDGKNGWNQRFGRRVNRGATGIAFFDGDYQHRARLKYYFDIADTHPGRSPRPVPLWTVLPEYSGAIIEVLENRFGQLSDKTSLASALSGTAQNAVEDHIREYQEQLIYYKEGSHLDPLLEDGLAAIYSDLLHKSISYMLLVRCGIDPSQHFTETDFSFVEGFNTPNTMNALGVATSDISQICIEEIAKTVLHLQNQNRTFAPQSKTMYAIPENKGERSNEHDHHIHHAGGLPPAQSAPAPGTGDPSWEVRIDAPQLPEETPQDRIHEPVDHGATELAPDGDRGNGPAQDQSDRVPDGEGTGSDGSTESPRPDEVGGPDEQHPAGSGGTDSDRADPRLTSQKPAAGNQELPAFSDHRLIMAIIENKDDDLKIKKEEIRMFFASHPDQQEQADFIKSAYHDRYTELITDGTRIGYKPQEDGLLMWEGAYLSRTAESVFSWPLVAELTAGMIDRQEYTINTGIKPLRSVEEQISFLDMSYRPSELEDDAQLAIESHFELSQQIIDEALCVGSNHQRSRLIICAQFRLDKPLEENAAFLRDFYGTNGAGFFFDGRKVSIWYTPEGIRIAQGDTALRRYATVLSWQQAAKRIRELLDLGRFMPQSEIDEVPDYARKLLTDRLLAIRREFSQEARDAKYLPLTSLAYDSNSGFPDIEAQMQKLMADPDTLEQLATEWESFAQAYDQNKSLLHTRRYDIHTEAEWLRDMQREHLPFRAAENYDPQRQYFISNDEIDALLRSGHSDYRLAVYSYFALHPGFDDQEKYMRNYHGEYSGSHGGNNSTTYTRKGISFSHGSILAPYAKVELNWRKATKRIIELIDEGNFLYPEDREAMPEYELKILSQKIHRFFSNAPSEFQRPYDGNSVFDYWETVKEVTEKLRHVDSTQAIYRKLMLPLWTQTTPEDKHYESRKADLDAMEDYIAGTFSVFGTGKTLFRPSAENFVFSDLVETQDEEQNPEWEEYQALQSEHPDAIVLYQMGDFFEVWGNHAEPVSQALGLLLTQRSIAWHEAVPMCGVPYHRLETYMNMLLHRGYDVVLASLEEDKRITAFLPSSHKENPSPDVPVGRIEYLSNQGTVAESFEYLTADSLIRDVRSENESGVPMGIVLYRDAEGQTISQDFLQELDPPPQSFSVIDSPYLLFPVLSDTPTEPEAELKEEPETDSVSKWIIIQAGNRIPLPGDFVDTAIKDRTIPHA